MTGRVLLAAAGTAIALLIVVAATVAGVAAVTPARSGVSDEARADVPASMLDLYQRAAATCPGLDWSVLAAVGKIETDHGRAALPGVAAGENYAGAAGPMQFLAPTFAAVTTEHPPPPGGAQPPSRYNPHDAVFSAAAYLCDSGARAGPREPFDLRAALFTYNRSSTYVAQVLDQARRYATTPTGAGGGGAATVPDPSGTGGLVTPTIAALHAELTRTRALPAGDISCQSPRPQNPGSDHPSGRACDLSFNAADPADVARGWQLAHHLAANAARLGITYLIWQGRIWTTESGAWTTYRSPIYRCPNPAEITGCHYDHIHVSTR